MCGKGCGGCGGANAAAPAAPAGTTTTPSGVMVRTVSASHWRGVPLWLGLLLVALVFYWLGKHGK